MSGSGVAAAASGDPAAAARAQLPVFFRRQHPLRQADDERCRHAVDRRHPQDPFEFFPARYEAQLLAGYSRNTPRKGLQVFMPDYVAKGGAPLPPPR